MGAPSVGSESVDEQWNLGFVSSVEDSTALLRHRLCSKVGGRPAWLDPIHLPSAEQLTCTNTGMTFNFLLQLYAPLPDDVEAAFHRVIFVFISSKGSGLDRPEAVKAFRCQLPRSNPYYSSDSQGKRQRFPPPLEVTDLQHMSSSDPWQVAKYEAALRAGAAAADLPSEVQLFKEMELVVEPESQSSTAGPEEQQHMHQLLQEYEDQRTLEGDESDADVPAEMLADVEAQHSEEDRCFAHFAAVVGSHPEQCVRYCFDQGAEPLWPSTRHVPQPEDIHPCPHCGTPRRFEFQILPHLLHYMNIDADNPENPDWASIAIYSCPNSCAAPDAASAYTEEFVWVQTYQL